MTKDDDQWSATIEHLIADSPARFRDDVSKVERRYSLETSATRNDLSLTFQCELWRVIGVLANGVMEDPQMEAPQGVRFFSAHDNE